MGNYLWEDSYMENYVTMSLELHLFFDRIMKEHSFFLQVGFVEKDVEYIKKASWFRTQFEKLLEEAVKMSNLMIPREVLKSGEIVTEYTLPAENKTSCLTGVPINSQITADEYSLKSGYCSKQNQELIKKVYLLNQKAWQLVSQLIHFKEQVLEEVSECRLYTTNYPLLIKHIIREAKLYQSLLKELETNGTISTNNMCDTEIFWNQIMMEHALFIRGLLDPSEEKLIAAADGFAKDYEAMIQEAKQQNCRAMDDLTHKAFIETERYRAYKAAGTKGITECQIASIILPLLADHVYREANHYLRILEDSCAEESDTYSDWNWG